MVFICNNEYNETKYVDIFQTYPFELSPFQKYAIQAIEENKHILITAHTGSGKTLPATHAIQKFCNIGKKVIYTSPIKSLSNQKFNEFTKKFTDISFGILTGDIKFNPEADCLIMTTEILRNNLFQQKTKDQGDTKQTLSFEMDTENDLSCVIFDEIHYINDKERGKIWEETIMMLPQHVLIVMLSATINKAEEFAKWIESIKKREVWLSSTNKRVVPLTHYSYTTLRDKLIEKHSQKTPLIDNELNKLVVMRNQIGQFNDKNFHKLAKTKHFFSTNQIFINKSFVLNNITKYMHEHNLLPAICFVFSRRKTEEFAKMISLSLNDSKTMNIIRKECKQLLISKLHNWKEYQQLPEFEQLVKLLEKGIAVHHSGIIPVFKEIIEIMFEKGYVKLLFATETFAVGVNMPTKTVLFTGLKKFDGNNFRNLLPHEYSQMAGRAGRRGLDTRGTVIHLNNMFDMLSFPEYRTILCGTSQTIESKFQINFNLILNLIANKERNLPTFISNSMMNLGIKNQENNIYEHIKVLEKKYDIKHNLLQYCTTSMGDLQMYANFISDLKHANRKKRKKILKNMQIYKNENKKIEEEVQQIIELEKISAEIFKLKQEAENVSNYINDTIKIVISILIDYGFVTQNMENLEYTLTQKGEIGSNIQEVNCLVFADILYNKRFRFLQVIDLVCIFSCFANVSIPKDERSANIYNKKINMRLKDIITVIQEYHHEIQDIELEYRLESRRDDLQYELCEYMEEWCRAVDESQCKIIYQKAKENGISIGVFIKAILKINNIAAEFEKICEIQNNLELLSKLKQIPLLTLKSIVTNQSLYI